MATAISTAPADPPGANGPESIRLGHAFRSAPTAAEFSDLEAVIQILVGHQQLTDRMPSAPDAVERAEKVLGAQPRPVYTFAGCLHPRLGTIGLVIAPGCLARCLQGASRCDTGGFISGKGGFRHVDAALVEGALLDLSFPPADNWAGAFAAEIESSFASPFAYVRGEALIERSISGRTTT